LITDVSRDGGERTWRRPAETRVALAVGMVALPVPLAHVAGVGFRWGALKVTTGHGTAFRVIRDHRRKRAQQAAAGERNRDAA
jgi:hypothetical protein